MSERFKELVLKTSDTAMCRGFESHSLRQIRTVIRIQSYPDYGSFFVDFIDTLKYNIRVDDLLDKLEFDEESRLFKNLLFIKSYCYISL